MIRKELPKFRKSLSRLGKGVEPELEKMRVSKRLRGSFEQLCRRFGLDGDAQLFAADPHCGCLRCRCRILQNRGHAVLTHLKGVIPRMQMVVKRTTGDADA